jgi:hypothetical protein
MGFGSSSTATWGSNLLRIALVLDNTGSMNDYGKIGALRTAAQNLVTQLSGLAKNPGDVYISVVPFVKDVNVGTSNVSASWLRWDQWDQANGYCSGGSWYTYSNCAYYGYTWKVNHSQWNGCVTDRDQSNDINSVPPTSYATDFIAEQYQYCQAAILPLSYNWTSINSMINSMTANGNTNQTIGLQWGWLSLLQQAPLNAPAESSNSKYQHIIILFTDGLNTQDRWYSDQASVDARMRALCDNIKQTSNVIVYTVQIDTDGAGQSAVLPYCASAPANFYMLTQASQISTAFASIGTSISKLRVAK